MHPGQMTGNPEALTSVRQITQKKESKRKCLKLQECICGGMACCTGGADMPNRNYNQTITLYCHISAQDTENKHEHWYRHVIHDCFFKSGISTSQDGTQVHQSNTYIARIPESEDYVSYGKWKNLTEEERKEKFTISIGDIIVLDECVDEIEVTSGNAAAKVLNRNKPNAFKVTAFSDNTRYQFAKHYRLGG